MILRCADRPYRAWTDESTKKPFGVHVSLAPNSGVRADIPGPPLWANARNRCAIARGGRGGAHRYGSTRGGIVGSVWVILS